MRFVFQIELKDFNSKHKHAPITLSRLWELSKMQTNLEDVSDIEESPAKQQRLDNQFVNLQLNFIV